MGVVPHHRSRATLGTLYFRSLDLDLARSSLEYVHVSFVICACGKLYFDVHYQIVQQSSHLNLPALTQQNNLKNQYERIVLPEVEWNL